MSGLYDLIIIGMLMALIIFLTFTQSVPENFVSTKCFSCESQMPGVAHGTKCFSCERQMPQVRHGNRCFSCETQLL